MPMMLIRFAALSIGPMMVTKGFATDWRIASEVPMTNNAARNIPYVLVRAAGQNMRAPAAMIHKPIFAPFLYPTLLSRNEAGTVITRYAI